MRIHSRTRSTTSLPALSPLLLLLRPPTLFPSSIPIHRSLALLPPLLTHTSSRRINTSRLPKPLLGRLPRTRLPLLPKASSQPSPRPVPHRPRPRIRPLPLPPALSLLRYRPQRARSVVFLPTRQRLGLDDKLACWRQLVARGSGGGVRFGEHVCCLFFMLRFLVCNQHSQYRYTDEVERRTPSRVLLNRPKERRPPPPETGAAEVDAYSGVRNGK
jgi:hypothetical protein